VTAHLSRGMQGLLPVSSCCLGQQRAVHVGPRGCNAPQMIGLGLDAPRKRGPAGAAERARRAAPAPRVRKPYTNPIPAPRARGAAGAGAGGDVESRYARAYEERGDPFRDFIAGERAARRRALSAPDRIMFELGQVVSSSRCAPALRACARALRLPRRTARGCQAPQQVRHAVLGHFRGKCPLPAHASYIPGCAVRAGHTAASELSGALGLRAVQRLARLALEREASRAASHRRACGAQVGARGRAGVHAAAARARVCKHGAAEPPTRVRGCAGRRGAGAAVRARGRGRGPAAAHPDRISFIQRRRAFCRAPRGGRLRRERGVRRLAACSRERGRGWGRAAAAFCCAGVAGGCQHAAKPKDAHKRWSPCTYASVCVAMADPCCIASTANTARPHCSSRVLGGGSRRAA
jgi:hypothetical protein